MDTETVLTKHQIDIDKAHDKIRAHDIMIEGMRTECERTKQRVERTESYIDEIRTALPAISGSLSSVKTDTGILHRDMDKLERANTALLESFNEHTMMDTKREREHIDAERTHTESLERLNRNLGKIAVAAVVLMILASFSLQKLFSGGFLSGLL
jgi:predicted  nucleic acid-binding Zn-ribbon protein